MINEEGDELQPLIDELNRLQETYDTQLPCIQQSEHPEEISAENVIEDLVKKIEALNDGSDRSCADCSKARRVEDLSSLQRGQHISIPGEHSSYFFKSLGKRISAYRHHAIVKEIVHISGQTAEVILIHFSKKDNVIKVREQKQTFNLQYDELYMIEYQYPMYDPNTIVQRAESILKQSGNGELFKSYNPFTKNCEHFAIWCVVGEKYSLQAHTFINDIKQMLCSIFGDGSNIARLILRLFIDSSEEIASFVTNAIHAIHLPSVVLGLRFAAHVIYCIIKTVYLIKQYRNEKKICWHCFKEKLLDLWLQLGVFGVTSVIIFVIVNFALPLLWPCAAIPIAILLVLVATALNLAVPRIRKALWSPVQYSKKEIKTLSELKVGDVASLTCYSLTHLVVVSEVQLDTNPKQGTVRGIHYSRPTLCGTRKIAEENFPIDLKSSKVYRVHFNIVSTHSPQEVVDQARKRVGERKWNMSSNRSDHLCRWAVEKSDYNSEEIKCIEEEDTEHTQSRSLSSLLVGKADVHHMNEIQPGDVVEYRLYKGIVIYLEDVRDGRVFSMHTVIRKSCIEFYVKKVILKIDLNKDNLKVHRYHPAHCISRSERVEKANDIIGKKIQRWTQTSFIQDIILKQRGNN
ncbi:hypothetical protein CHS0354_039292 [Potamilus streckersoni]|uniref:LRAT domain-containing protein n=1 Tax=Potamilus streckersoni TaxID=2493646 RepID=A0AAE0RNG0_9BIVA|nr:hypothetical protein CHS0354_039292 [Potamilus streckersoni]